MIFSFALFGQELRLEKAIPKLAYEIQANCKEQGSQSVVIIGFYTKDGRNTKFNTFLKEKIAENFKPDYFKVVDQNVVDAFIEDHPFSLNKSHDHDLLNSYSNYLFDKTDQSVTIFLYGIITDEDDNIKVSAYLVSDAMFDDEGTASVKIIASDVTDKLLGRIVTHKPYDEPQAAATNTTQNNTNAAQVQPNPPSTVTTQPVMAAQTDPSKVTEQSKPVVDTAAKPSGQKVLYRGGADPLKGLNIAEEKKALQIGQYYALIIGIDKYSGIWPRLTNAVNDAKALEALLKSKYRFDDFRTLYDEQATRENIIKQLEWLTSTVKVNDNVLIYYSGHGEFKQELNKGYWVPVNATTNSTADYISNNDIQTFLGGIKSKHTLLVSDACFSGDIFRGKTVTIPFEESEKYYSKIYNLISRKAITSGGIEPVMDGGKDGHSIFAYYLLKGLTNNNNNYYDASQLYDAIRIPVINNSTQTPNFQPIKDTGDEGGQFIFIKK